MMEEELMQEYIDAMEEQTGNFPREKEKENILSFFKRVIFMPDTTRTSNLDKDEIGQVKVPVRTNLSLSLYAQQMGLAGLGNHFFKESQIISDSSLSKEGFLDKLAVTQKREMESKTRRANLQQKKGWFSRKEPEPQQEYY